MRAPSSVREIVHYQSGEKKLCGNSYSYWRVTPSTEDWTKVTCKTCKNIKGRRERK